MSGKPNLIRSLTSLTTSCLQEHEKGLCDELEPIVVCDLLFEEEAINIFDHDIITETKQRQKQITRLIEHLKENKKDCFHYFLYILQKEEFKTIRKMLENPHSNAVGKGMSGGTLMIIFNLKERSTIPNSMFYN